MEIIRSRQQLIDFRDRHGMRDDWHEPDEQGVDAYTTGGINTRFDNAHLSPPKLRPGQHAPSGSEAEHGVVLTVDGEDVAYVNLAALFALATGKESL